MSDIKNLLIQILYQTAYADGVFDVQEKAFVAEVMEREGFDPASFVEEELVIPNDEKDRMSILYHMLFLIRADEKITQSEKSIVHKIGLTLGFRREMISDMLTIMQKYLKEKLPQDELVKIIMSYKN